jgi:CBS domain-containing protein
MDDLADGIRARHLALPLERALCVLAQEDAEEAAREPRERQFGATPVLRDGELVGVFHVGDIEDARARRAVADVMRPLAASLVVSSEAPLSALLRRMCYEPFLFVVNEDGISAFVTTGDLGTVPVRTHFYLKLAHLESVLGEYLRAVYEDQMEAIARLSHRRQEVHARIAKDLRAKDKFIDDLSCISLDDLVRVAGMDDGFRQATEQGGIRWEAATSELADFRNEIMHPSRTFAGAADSQPDRLVEWEDRLGALVRAAENPVGG